MDQGSLSDSCYHSLDKEEVDSLAKIREYYKNSDVSGFGVENTLSFADCSYEAMGRRFRSRINRETKSFGCYSGELDGVDLIISSAIGCYDNSKFITATPGDASNNYKRHKKQVKKATKLSNNAFLDIKAVLNAMLPITFFKVENQSIKNTIQQLDQIQVIVDEQISRINLNRRGESRAEHFINTVCGYLVCYAGIKPTKPLTDSKERTPLLRFLEVFYPVEAESILSTVYDRERKLPPSQKIGANFIKPR